MPSFYFTQSPVGSDSEVGPADETYAPIPNLQPLTITDEFLQFGGTASLSLFLGAAYSGNVISFSLYARIIDTTTNTVVAEVCYGGTNGLDFTPVTLSAVYSIAPNAQPVLVAQWKVSGSPGVVSGSRQSTPAPIGVPGTPQA